jgi:4-amino-4-deoxy-L-arabinose transferase-like glycosyltransferase
VGTALAGVGVAVFVLVLYMRTLAPTILPYDSPDLLDVPMLQMQVCVLGMTHPTGYPSYILFSHLFTYLPIGDCAYRVNLASATYAALAVLSVFAAGYLLGRRVAAAAAGALAFGVGVTLWSQAVIAEVYTLNALFVALTLLALLLWRERRKDRYFLLSAFLVGLSLTNHLTSGLLLPASLLFVALVDRRKLANVKLMLGSAGLFLVGLLPYLYLPVRSAMDPPFEANNPSNIERFFYVVSGGSLRGGFFAFGPAELPARLAFYWGHLLDNLHWGLLVAAMVGFVSLLLWDRPAAGLLGFLLFGWVFYSVENDIR